MNRPKSDKAFDCVDLKREVQARIYEQIKHMPPAAEIEYFKRAANEGPLGDRWRAIRESASADRLGNRPSNA